MSYKETDRISKTYHLAAMPRMEHYSWMFIQDFHQSILPIQRSKQENLTIEIEPKDPSLEALIIEILGDSRPFMREDFTKTIIDFTEQIASYVTHYGFIVFEYVTYKDINDNLSYRLKIIQGEETKIRKRKVIQLIPHEAVKEFSLPKEIEIPKSKCYVIEFPNSLGGKKDYIKFLREFKEFGSKTPFMNYFKNKLVGQPGYDLNEDQRTHELELWKLTNKFGWHHRANSNKLFSQYHYVYRYLRFKRNKIVLRDSLLENVKGIITEIGGRFNKKITLKIDGLMTVEK